MIKLMDHNQITYEKLCKTMNENNKCALIQATGTGKSYIAGRYLEEFSNNALILVPSNAIKESWENMLCDTNSKYKVITYQTFTRNTDKYYDHDLIIADEMHHLGSNIWGKNFVETYLKSNNHKIIGLTATEIRYLDNSRDMAHEIFDDIKVNGINLPDAINSNVLPSFKYITSFYCTSEDIKRFRKRPDKINDIEAKTKLKGQLEYCIENLVSVKSIIDENLTDDYKKIIIFMNNVETKDKSMQMFKKILPAYKIYSCDCRNLNLAKKSINDFRNDNERSILFAIDMLNEGVHIPGVDCVIMFRKTISPQVYFQQLGRALSSKYEKNPIIFDFVANIDNLKYVDGIYNKYSFGDINKQLNKDKYIIFKSYNMDLVEILKKIGNFFNETTWTKEEDDYLKANFESMKVIDLAKQLNKPESSTGARCRILGLRKKSRKKFYDISLLEDYEFCGETINKISEKTGLPFYYVKKYMKCKGIDYKINKTSGPLSDYEKKYIVDNYKYETLEEIGKKINRSQSTIYGYLKRSGYNVPRKKIKP